MENMASRKTKHTKTTISEEHKKALVCVWFTSKVQLVNNCYDFMVAKDLRIDWKSFIDICKWRLMKPANSPNRMEELCNQMPEKLKPEYG